MSAAPQTVAWTPRERESFIAATARHRKAARRFDLLCGACVGVLAFVVAVLTAPLLYGLMGLVLDLINLLVPTPDLQGAVSSAIFAVVDAPAEVSWTRWCSLAVLAALPGLVAMGLVLRSLSRVMREAMCMDAAEFAVRAPNLRALEEQRFANVVAEMAIAAGLPAPRVLVSESASPNAAAFGLDEEHGSIIFTTGLLERLDRAQLQGVAAHLIATIANGDLRSGARVATTLGLFGLVARLSSAFADRRAAAWLWQLLRSALRRQASADDGRLAMALSNPFDDSVATVPAHAPAPASGSASAPPSDTTDDRIPWRTIAWMPLVGPLVISGFLGGMLATFVLSPILALGWRRRKLLADATAVKLTREPNTLGDALQKLRGVGSEGGFAPWIEHLTVTHAGRIGSTNLLGASGVRMFPSVANRLKGLGVLGASVTIERGPQMPRLFKILLVPVGLILISLFSTAVVLLVYVSVALAMLFTWFPAVLLNVLLR